MLRARGIHCSTLTNGFLMNKFSARIQAFAPEMFTLIRAQVMRVNRCILFAASFGTHVDLASNVAQPSDVKTPHLSAKGVPAGQRCS